MLIEQVDNEESDGENENEKDEVESKKRRREDIFGPENIGAIENIGGKVSEGENTRSETESNEEMLVYDNRDHAKHKNQTVKHKHNEIDDVSDLDSDIEELIAPCMEDNDSNHDEKDTEYLGTNEPYLKHIDPLLQMKTCT